MTKEQQMVREFHAQLALKTESGRDIPPLKPEIPQDEIIGLRLKLIHEELIELTDGFNHYDLVEMSDAIGDLLYVVYGAAVACGIDLEPVFNEIHKSNMTKFVDGWRRDDGKWMKGPSYVPPQLGAIILAQSNS